MLLDWVTAHVSVDTFSLRDRLKLLGWGDRICRVTPSTGEVVWEVSAWDSVRSDSHQVAMRVSGDRVSVQGSPARVCGDGDTVFGSGASRALDLAGCIERMSAVGLSAVGVEVPSAELWEVSRVDVTGMLLLDDLAAVRTALAVLRSCEGGRYRVSQQAGDTVYWSHKSRLRAGKAYAKGPHLVHALKRCQGSRSYTAIELSAANRLLRLELRLGAQWWRERSGGWRSVTADRLRGEWEGYFGRMLGDAEMVNNGTIADRLNAVASTPGQARAALGTWCLIQAYGWESARAMTTTRKWYKDLRLLRDAGLGDADIAAGRVVPLRRKVAECREVHSWGELLAA